MVYGAYGLVEVLGDTNSVVVVDRMLKTAEVNFETTDTIFNSAVVSNPSEEMINIVEAFKARKAKK